MSDPNNLRVGLVAELSRHEWLTTPEWRAAFGDVPRHLFLRRFFTLTTDQARYEAIHHSHPDWVTLVYHNAVYPTQLDGDDTRWDHARAHGPITGKPTCSSTQPSLMAVMLEALDIRDGHRVLEIGTGTGYNAALLAHRLGDDHIVTLDVDAILVKQARQNLADAGLRANRDSRRRRGRLPRRRALRPGDRHLLGSDHPTCVASPGKTWWVILTNIHRQLVGDSLVRLTVREDQSAAGHLLNDQGGFMPLRAHRHTDPAQLIRTASQQDGDLRESHLPTSIRSNGQGWVILADLLMTDVSRTDIARPDGDVQWLVHPDGSWSYHETTTSTVEQGGPRRLWDELERIHQLWTDHGKPGRDQIGLTVTPSGDHHIWLHHDANVVTKQLRNQGMGTRFGF